MANAEMINDVVILDSTNNIFIFETRTKQPVKFEFQAIDSTSLDGIFHITNFDGAEIKTYARKNLNDSYSKIIIDGEHFAIKTTDIGSNLIYTLLDVIPESVKFELENTTSNTKVVLRYKN
jgi:hypothetical protein